MAVPLHYFVEVGDDLNPVVVGTSCAGNGPRALVLFADKRYGKSEWNWKLSHGRKYIISKDGRCLEASPFPRLSM